MAVHPVRLFGDPVLRTPADPVTSFDDRLARTVSDLMDTVAHEEGAGLAAPQIGLSTRVFVYTCGGRSGHLVNPEWEPLGDETVEETEGCLSIPDHYAEVTRPAEVRLSWTGLDGRRQARDFDGLWATCVQHELDHLDGRLFIDHIGPMRRQMITRKMEKLKREMARA